MERKILIHTRNLAIPGGKQTFFLALEDHYTNEVQYFFYGAKSMEKESIPQFLIRFFGDYFRFYRCLKKERFDLVHINTSFNPKSYIRDSIFTWISKSTKHKTIVYWHGWKSEFEEKVARKSRIFFRSTFGKADAMICLAREFAEKLKAYRYSKPVFVETTVVDDAIIDLQGGMEIEKNKSFRILFLSRVEKEKGIYETLASFNALRGKFANLKLIVGGIGNEYENAISYVDTHQIKDVEFLGWVEGDQKLNVLRNADIFVLPSYHEGMPISLLEAMASGIPVITTQKGGVKDFFVEGKMGFEVASKDAIDLEAKLEKMLLEPSKREAMGSYNADYAKEHFTPLKVCRRLERIYDSLISEEEMLES